MITRCFYVPNHSFLLCFIPKHLWNRKRGEIFFPQLRFHHNETVRVAGNHRHSPGWRTVPRWRRRRWTPQQTWKQENCFTSSRGGQSYLGGFPLPPFSVPRSQQQQAYCIFWFCFPKIFNHYTSSTIVNVLVVSYPIYPGNQNVLHLIGAAFARFSILHTFINHKELMRLFYTLPFL